ncbi:MAG: hypothetical protein RID53_19405 [Coleofasciculus sp. B1-GNL1-01]|uniref:hypothetical protein n=1 Tax=Coleofasciculus sp. B1-GNL1-01 TaxID=3068484 RepID=UPI0032FFE9AC
MPFFIQNVTKCAICDQVIDNRYDAAQLPYIHPKVSSSLAQLARRFVHRSCWREWKDANLFSTAAFNLAKEVNSHESALKIEFASDGLIVFWVAAMNSYRWQDFKLLVTIDIPVSEAFRMGNHIVSAFLEKDFHRTFLMGDYIWKIRRDDSENVEFTIKEGEQLADKFIVATDRHSCWVNAMKEIIAQGTQKVGEIPTVSTSGY